MSILGLPAQPVLSSIPTQALFYAPLMHKTGTSKDFCIMPARPEHSAKITALYNRWIPDESAGMRVTEDHIAMRLDRDPNSVLAGFFAPDYENPVSLINVVKLAIDASSQNFCSLIPKSHQELTGNDTFSTTDPKGNVWFCPWVAMHPDAFGYALYWRNEFRNAARLHVLTVASLAIQSGFATRLFAYSRPINLKENVERVLDTALTHRIVDGELQVFANGELLGKDRTAVYRWLDDKKAKEVVNLPSLLDEKSKFDDTGFRLHDRNGGKFRLALVFPNGQIYDTQSLGFRTCFEYDLGLLRSYFEETPLPFTS